ncbi:hypothetical protein PHMEG_00021521 [Phytophthora megakarya]|uniref:Uncharacterized protein n=1 Tax=Phytophthora megakarya TaxID=4795 RepID=A0A225VNY4_9STRA|nr:hypothetical protein PHMEG_00021521 [Phytophthora megakarya]
MMSEMTKGNKSAGSVLLAKAVKTKEDTLMTEETARQLRKRRKRLERTKARRERRTEREKLAAKMVEVGTSTTGKSTRDRDLPGQGLRRLAAGVVAESDVVLPEPTSEFREALGWSASAAHALREVEARNQELKDGLANLAVAETRRQEGLTAGGVVDENEMREGVAPQLVMTAAGLDAVREHGWVADVQTTTERRRRQRRHEKRERKARAKKRREWLTALVNAPHSDKDYFVFDEVYKPKTMNKARVLSPEEAEAIASESWTAACGTSPDSRLVANGKCRGDRLGTLPPVDYVEGFTGAVSKVLGVWRFRFRTQYEQTMVVDALVVEGATTEFLLGENWMMQNGVKIDFVSCEMKWYEGDARKVVPFWCTGDETRGRSAKARMVRRARTQVATCHNVEVAVAAPDGTVGLFTPKAHGESHILLGPTLTTVHEGRVAVPVMNRYGRSIKLPPKEKLGTWTPTSEDIIVLAMDGELDRSRVKQWLEVLSSQLNPLNNEDKLNIGDMSLEDKELFYCCYVAILSSWSRVTAARR